MVLHESVTGFTTTWDYTTLKHEQTKNLLEQSFTTTWDYTTLKPLCG